MSMFKVSNNLPLKIGTVRSQSEKTRKTFGKTDILQIWPDRVMPLVILFSFISRKLPDQTMLPQNNATTTQMGLSQNEIEIGDFDLTNLPELDENFEIPDFEEFSSEIEEEENENLSQQQQISNSKVQTMPDQIISSPEQVKISQPKPINSEVERNNSDVDTVSLNISLMYHFKGRKHFGNFFPYLEVEGSVYRKKNCLKY